MNDHDSAKKISVQNLCFSLLFLFSQYIHFDSKNYLLSRTYAYLFSLTLSCTILRNHKTSNTNGFAQVSLLVIRGALDTTFQLSSQKFTSLMSNTVYNDFHLCMLNLSLIAYTFFYDVTEICTVT